MEEILKETVLHARHIKLGAKMAPFAGFDMPIEYAGIVPEHLAVRQKAGLFDVSHMGEIRIKGKQALAFVDFVGTNKASNAEVGRVIYTVLCTPEGGAIDDLFIYKVGLEEVILVVNASNVAIDYAWLVKQAESFDVTVSDESEDWAEIALQGPLSSTVLPPILGVPLDDLFFMRFKWVSYHHKKMLVSRSGYTGEDGFELYGPPEVIAELWDRILALPDISPCGLGCRDTLRFEAGLPLYGHELSRDISPLEIGFDFAVKFDKDFIGKPALLQQKEKGLPLALVGLEIVDRGIARQGYPVVKDGIVVGRVTTGYLLPGHDHALAMALVQRAYATIGQSVNIEIRQKYVNAIVREPVFYDKKYRRK